MTDLVVAMITVILLSVFLSIVITAGIAKVAEWLTNLIWGYWQ